MEPIESDEESNENKEEQKPQKQEKPEEKKEKKAEEKKEEKIEELEEKLEVQTGQKPEKPTKPLKPRARLFSSEWYDKNYKKFLFVAIAILVLSLITIVIFYAQNGDIMKKDVTLTGGTIITVYTSDVNIAELESFLQDKVEEFNVRKLEDITTKKTIAFIVETTSEASTIQAALEEFLGYELDSTNSSIEISGSTLAKTFYNQLLIALLIAFIFMAIVVFIIFKTAVPSLAVVFAAATDIIATLALIDLLGFRVSAAGIAALLMLIGYSVDTDTMLTTKVIKRRGEGTVNSRIGSAFKTGIIMTLTSLMAVLVGYFVAQSTVLKEIFFVLSCGLFIDILTTWLGNAAIVKLYCVKKKIN